MTKEVIPFKISLDFDFPICENYKHTLQELLQSALPEKFLTHPQDLKDKHRAFLLESLPLIEWSNPKDSTHFLISLICKHRIGASQFFYDMINRYLLFPKQLNSDVFYSCDFYLKEILDEKLIFCQMGIVLNSQEEVEKIHQNKRLIETEIRLGVLSGYHATRIAQFKGLSSDDKTAMIQDKIVSLIQARKEGCDSSIVSQMQRFLVSCKEEFKSDRDPTHISKIISILDLLRKLLVQKVSASPDKRHAIVKLLKTAVNENGKKRAVLGVLVGINILKEYEIFEESHLIKAISHFIAQIKPIKNSFFIDRNKEKKIQVLYLEIEKEDTSDFTIEEVGFLREGLEEKIKGHVESLIHSVFMPRNEEEVLRNMVTLSRQLKYVQDIPQVIISFDQQQGSSLGFTVVFLRVLKSNSPSIASILEKKKPKLKATVERVRKLGLIRKRYAKEASVFRVSLPSHSFLRDDHSIDLYKARNFILLELFSMFGEVRDYNGGMIDKQNQVFSSLKTLLGELGNNNNELLEKFFYSIRPVEMRSVLDPLHLKNLFFLFINLLKRKTHLNYEQNRMLIKCDQKGVYIAIKLKTILEKKQIDQTLEKLGFASFELIRLFLQEEECFGLILLSDEKEKQKTFLEQLRLSLATSS